MQSLRSRPEKTPPKKYREYFWIRICRNAQYMAVLACTVANCSFERAKVSQAITLDVVPQENLQCYCRCHWECLGSPSSLTNAFPLRPPWPHTVCSQCSCGKIWQCASQVQRKRDCCIRGGATTERGCNACQANKNVFEKMKISGREAYAFPMLDYCDHPRKWWWLCGIDGCLPRDKWRPTDFFSSSFHFHFRAATSGKTYRLLRAVWELMEYSCWESTKLFFL